VIPDIGIMVAAYIVTRMAALLGQRDPNANVVARILALLTIIITVICAADLLTHSVSIPPP